MPDWQKTVTFDQVTGRYVEPEQPTSQTVWWVVNPRSKSVVYHTHRDCPSLASATHPIASGTIEDARRAGHTRLCKNCEQMH